MSCSHHWASAKTAKPGLAGDVYAYPVYWFATSQPCGDFIERVTAELLIDPICSRPSCAMPATMT
ncbi:MAG: hypothetical protein R2857_09710 [Vampirovibrionales bacterium]